MKRKEIHNTETVSGTSRYAGTIETIKYIEYMMNTWIENGIKPDVAFNLGQVLKYLSSRLGKKDDVKVELGKAENYLHRALTGNWLVP